MQEQLTNIADLKRVLKKRLWSLVLPVVGCLVLAIAVALLLSPIFRSTSTILIEEQEIPQDYVMTTVTGFAEQRLETINQRIMGTTKLLEIINRFDLYNEMRKKKTTEEVIKQMREDIDLETISAQVMDRRTGRATAATIAFTLSYEGENPRTVQQIANVLTSLYLEENLRVREEQSVGASNFLGTEMNDLQQELTEIEALIAAFKQEHLNSLPELVQFNLQSLERNDREIDQYQVQLRSLGEREAFLETQLATVPADNVNTDRSRLEDLRIQLINLRTRVSDQYPDVIKIKREIAELEQKLRVSRNEPAEIPENQLFITLSSQLASIGAESESIKKQIVELEKRRDQFRKRIEAAPRVEEKYTALRVKRSSLMSKYDELSKKYMEAKVAEGLEKEQMGERFTLIDAARLPEKPVRPNKLAIILIGLVLGMGAGVALAAVREYTDHSVATPEALARAVSVPVLATIPLIVTPEDLTRKKRQRLLLAGSMCVLLVVGVVGFHFLVMDLDIFWAKLNRRLAL